MITTTQMYWLTRLDDIRGVLIGLGLAGIVAVILAFAVGLGLRLKTRDYSWETVEGVKAINAMGSKLLRVALPLFSAFMIFSFTGFALTPSSRDMAAILVVPAIVNSEKVQVVGSQLYELAVEWMEELRPNKVIEKKGDQK